MVASLRFLVTAFYCIFKRERRKWYVVLPRPRSVHFLCETYSEKRFNKVDRIVLCCHLVCHESKHLSPEGS